MLQAESVVVHSDTERLRNRNQNEDVNKNRNAVTLERVIQRKITNPPRPSRKQQNQ